MAFAFALPLRIVQAVLAIIILGLTAYVVDVIWGTSHSVNFMLFTSVWTLLVVIYLAAITMIFWFASWVAVATLWGDADCGSSGGACGAGTAAIVFSAIEWLTFVATTVMAALHVSRSARSDPNPDPHMEVQHV